MNTFIFAAIWAVVACISSLLLVPLCIKLAYYFDVIDHPDNKLKVHASPTPYLGGLALLASFILPVLLYMPRLTPGLLILFALGLADDKLRLPPRLLFFGHSIAALAFLAMGFVAHIFPYAVLNYSLSFFWLVSIINAFNLIDVMDGLATTTSLWCVVAFFCFGVFLQQSSTLPVLAALFGALLGFLNYNKPRARIYLGDAGSLSLGGFFAALALHFPWNLLSPYYLVIPFLILLVPITEIVGLILIRFYKGIPFYKGSPDHICHYLKRSGMSQMSILCFVSLVSALSLSLSVSFFLGYISWTMLIVLVALLSALWSLYIGFNL